MAEKYSYSIDGKVAIKDANDKPLVPVLGRFLQTDPLKFRAGDVNTYRYVGNRFLNFTDPSGLVCGNGTWGCGKTTPAYLARPFPIFTTLEFGYLVG